MFRKVRSQSHIPVRLYATSNKLTKSLVHPGFRSLYHVQRTNTTRLKTSNPRSRLLFLVRSVSRTCVQSRIIYPAVLPDAVYIPPAYAQLFGRDELVAHKRLLTSSSSINSAPTSHPPSPHGSASPFPFGTGHSASSPAPGTPIGVTTPIPGSSATTTTAGGIKPGESIWRALQRGYNRALGPLFVSAVEKFNTTLVDIRPEIAVHLATAFPSPSADVTGVAAPSVPGLNMQLWQILCELVAAQCYQRVVGPQIGSVHDYEPFSDNVYGELEPM